MNRKLVVVTTLAFVVVACGSDPFKEFYHPNNISSITLSRRVAPAPEKPIFWRGNDPQADPKALYRQGYVIVGYSSFNGGKIDWDDARDLGQTLGADVVVTYSKYTHTISGMMPMVTPTTQTSSTTMNGTAYGSGGVVTGYGNATTTTLGTQTTYIPYSVQRSDYFAYYVIKIKPVLGAGTSELSDVQRQAIQSNSGAAVDVIMDGSPAFVADVLPGDIITKVNGDPIEGGQTFMMRIEQHAGQTVKLTIWRNGETIEKTITLNP